MPGVQDKQLYFLSRSHFFSFYSLCTFHFSVVKITQMVCTRYGPWNHGPGIFPNQMTNTHFDLGVIHTFGDCDFMNHANVIFVSTLC